MCTLAFINDPRLEMPILEVHKDNHELYVRRCSLPSCGARDPNFRAKQDAYLQITTAAARLGQTFAGNY